MNRLYVRGLGLLGQYGTPKAIKGSRKFIEVNKFTEEPITQIAAGYFGNACATSKGKVYYWGWQFCPVTGFRLLMIYNEGSFISRTINSLCHGKNMIATPKLIYDFNQPICKLSIGNAYVMVLTNTGNLFGFGSNDSVTFKEIVGSAGG
jgi:alpha-tubulin suppressor-like RCC1 family protein